ncbi:MAG: hypothetical protein CFH16_00077 [Alphaproteobacteria bacterium MarineAlpha5_Bin6]|nr:MAG: hypothetical protein CFH17_00158 [Alphaproteobacteria bacterium MarineAlpha5_Bin7]PPR54900.1 MAG: hypothetical protein CFH16_00077 [Alphaproteobacteria bacterium MarineAlpha5_Bin6]
MKNILFAGIFHETNCFLQEKTRMKDFDILKKNEIFELKGDCSQVSGFIDFSLSNNLNIIPIVNYTATPSGIVEDEVLEYFWQEFERESNEIKSTKIDAIFLSLHGAMITESIFDVEGEILKRIKKNEYLKNVPIFGVFDLHANFTKSMAKNSNGLICYQKNPHTDAYDTGFRAAKLMFESLNQKKIPKTYFVNANIIWPPSGTGTLNDPMKTLEKIARKYEQVNDDILAINVIGGFSFADVPESGVAFSIISNNENNKILEELKLTANKLKNKGLVQEDNLEEVIRKICKNKYKEPILLVEPADNIGGGSQGNGTDILRTLVSNKLENSGVIINDPDSVHELQTINIGEYKDLQIGGKNNPFDKGPLKLNVKLINKTNGSFVLEDKQSHLAASRGQLIEMGPCAVVNHNGITILLTSKKTPPFDLGQWRSQGINPETFSLIGVKAAVAYRQAYDKISNTTFIVETAGPCSNNPRKLPYKNVPHSIFPLRT